MPFIQVSMAAGRTPEQVRELIHELTDVAVRVAKAPPEAVTVVITEVEHDKWATADKTIAESRAESAR
jgi:4-oxalocrotonate tautomerase